jgi:signal transduction histidine kinase
MKTRARLISAHFHLGPNVRGTGTRITLTLPTGLSEKPEEA